MGFQCLPTEPSEPNSIGSVAVDAEAVDIAQSIAAPCQESFQGSLRIENGAGQVAGSESTVRGVTTIDERFPEHRDIMVACACVQLTR